MRYMASEVPHLGSNSHALHWKVKSQPLDHQGSPRRWRLREHFEALINGCDAVCEHRLIQGVGQTASQAIHLVLGLPCSQTCLTSRNKQGPG